MTAGESTRPPANRRRWLLGVVAILVVIAAGTVIVLTNRSSAPDAGSTAEAQTTSAIAVTRSDAAVSPATAAVTDSPAATTPTPTMDIDDAVPQGVQSADDLGVSQAVAVLDRDTGQIVASSQGDRTFDTMSVTKLFTAAYYLVQSDGRPDADLADQLEQMITASDDDIQIALWDHDIVGFVADRYGLEDTYGSGSGEPNNWGSDKITANDMVTFLYLMSADPMVGPYLMDWMSAAEPTGLDGFNQAFGLNALTGDHGSKQGWSDDGFYPRILNSVGWTGHYFVAILERSDESFSTMRTASTTTATLISRSR